MSQEHGRNANGGFRLSGPVGFRTKWSPGKAVHVITFTEEPELHLIKRGSLRTKTQFIRRMPSGFHTDFQMVFDKILEVAVKGN